MLNFSKHTNRRANYGENQLGVVNLLHLTRVTFRSLRDNGVVKARCPISEQQATSLVISRRGTMNGYLPTEARRLRLKVLGSTEVRRLSEKYQLPLSFWTTSFLLDQETVQALRRATEQRGTSDEHRVTA